MKKRNITLLTLIALVSIPSAATIVNGNVAQAATKTYTIKKQSDLDKYLKESGSDWSSDIVTFDNSSTITFPKNKTYTIKSGTLLWNVISNSGADIDFNGSKVLISSKGTFQTRIKNGGIPTNRKLIKNGSIYGSTSISDKGNYYATALNAHNFGFYKMNFQDAQKMGSHLFDLAGSIDFDFNYLNVKGYGKKNVKEQSMVSQFNKDPHSIYAEAIQIDSSASDSFGKGALKTSTYSIYKNIKVPNNINDKNAKITTGTILRNSTFTGYNGVTGEGLINKNNNLKSNQTYSPTAIGSHSGNKTGDAKIYNNTFQSTIRTNVKDNKGRLYTDKRVYPIHFRNPKYKTIDQHNNKFKDVKGYNKSDGYANTGLYVAFYR